MEDAGSLEALLAYLGHQRNIIDYMHVAAFALLIYDFLLTINLEITTIWLNSKWNYTKILYLAARYIPFLTLNLVLQNQVVLDVDPHTCSWSYPTAIWLVLIGVAFAECILALRTFAVWFQNRKIMVLLVLLQVAVFVVTCISSNSFIQSMKFAPAPYAGFRGCFVVEANNSLWICFAALTISQTVILALMLFRALQSYRASNMNELSRVIHVDGILFYIYILCVAIANLAIILVLPADFANILTPLQSVFHAVFTSRIIMNIRNVGIKELTHLSSARSQAVLPSVQENPTLVFWHEDDEPSTSDGRTRKDVRYDANIPMTAWE